MGTLGHKLFEPLTKTQPKSHGDAVKQDDVVKLYLSAHVDHVIPWSFVKGDNLWNFVLACPSCNTRKKNRLPTQAWLAKVITRNEEMANLEIPLIQEEFRTYSAEQMWKIWEFAKIGGMRVYEES